MSNKIALSIDIEDWYHDQFVFERYYTGYQSADIPCRIYKDRYDYITRPTERVLELLDYFGIRATFFVVADVCFHYPKLIDLLSKSRHEVACHGRYHYPLLNRSTGERSFSLQRFESMTKEARTILERHTNKTVYGYRAPHGYIDFEMLRSLQAIRFRYDSSVAVNSLYKKARGFGKEITTKPEVIAFDERRDGNGHHPFVELPWAYYDLFGFRIPTAGGFFLRALGKGIISLGLRQSLRRGDTMLYFHALDLCREEFPVRSTNGRPFYWVRKGKKTEDILLALFREYRHNLTTCYEVYRRTCENSRS